MEKGGNGKWVALERLAHEVIGACVRVHKELGPGFLESIYQRAIEIELAEEGVPFEPQKEIELWYRGQLVGKHRLDLLVDGRLVLEVKAVEKLTGQHYAQVRSYLRATGNLLGILANFAEATLDPRRVELK